MLSIVIGHVFAVSSWVPAREEVVGLRLSMYFSVDLLFVVSGFVMLLPAVARGSFGSVRSYGLRRVAKIVPSYYVSILVTLAVLAMIPAWYPSRHDVPAVVAHLLFLQVPFSWESVGLGSNLLWWSLSTIAAFYPVLPAGRGALPATPAARTAACDLDLGRLAAAVRLHRCELGRRASALPRRLRDRDDRRGGVRGSPKPAAPAPAETGLHVAARPDRRCAPVPAGRSATSSPEAMPDATRRTRC